MGISLISLILHLTQCRRLAPRSWSWRELLAGHPYTNIEAWSLSEAKLWECIINQIGKQVAVSSQLTNGESNGQIRKD